MERPTRPRRPKKKSALPRAKQRRGVSPSEAAAGPCAPVEKAAPDPAAAEPAAAGTRYSLREGHLLLVDDISSARMGQVRQKGTKPELVVRSLLSSLGHRFRVSRRGLSGSPDIVNASRRWVVFVHGCFWHRHGCKATTTPGRNREFWEAKFQRNVERDRRSIAALEALGYTVIVVWECETKRELEPLRQKLAALLGPRPSGVLEPNRP
jgi:DNA mismatch endonuclease (patch repair protein)